MTDTVNVPREWLEEWKSELALKGAGRTNTARDIDAMLAAAPKAEPVAQFEAAQRMAADLGYKLVRDDEIGAPYLPEAPKVEQAPVAWMVDIYGSATVVWSRVHAERAAQNGFAVMSLYTQPAPSSDELLEALKRESWDLRSFNVPTGGGDYDIGWRVVGHWEAEPRERTISEVFEDDPAAAIRAAIAQHKGPQS